MNYKVGQCRDVWDKNRHETVRVPASHFIFLAEKLYPLLQHAESQPELRFYATELPEGFQTHAGSCCECLPWHTEYRTILMDGNEFVKVTSLWEDEEITPLRRGEKIQTRMYLLGKEVAFIVRNELHVRLRSLKKKHFEPLLQFMQN